ncbi:MAG: hypothetical protein A2603_09400 [Bdellovibrionales bacterium RIFOXYD1_FULL_55_31]|nr:MAG: hypothetical protein A2603_09400 [Bdellovibrionales bacterium RIFOXYD1_FULL_55_31]
MKYRRVFNAISISISPGNRGRKVFREKTAGRALQISSQSMRFAVIGALQNGIFEPGIFHPILKQ